MAYGEAPLPLGLGDEEVVRREQASLFLAETLSQAGEEVAESWEMRNTVEQPFSGAATLRPAVGPRLGTFGLSQ